jgi:predicted MFS family arabinose efflux permease
MTYSAMNSFLAGGIGVAGRDVGLTEFECGLALSLGALSAMVVSPLWGTACDRWGRRNTLLLVLPMLTLAAGVLALALGGATGMVFATLVAGRLLQSGFGSAVIPISQAVMADRTVQSRRTGGMALVSGMLALGTTGGSLLLATTSTSGLATGFVMLAGTGAAALLLIGFCFRDPKANSAETTTNEPLSIRSMWPHLLITAAGFSAYTMIVPLHGLRLLDQGGLSPGEANAKAGLILLAGGAALILAQAVIALGPEPNPRTLLRWGSIGALPGLAALALSETVTSMALSASLIGFSLGLAATANLALVSLAAGPDAQGRAAGMNASMRALGIAIGPLIGLGLYQPGGMLPFIAGAMLIGVVILASFRR